jgi:hypothetical protein
LRRVRSRRLPDVFNRDAGADIVETVAVEITARERSAETISALGHAGRAPVSWVK